MKRKAVLTAIVLCLIYVSSYILVRQTRREIWERNGEIYVIFPENKGFYYLYRPQSIIDEKLTGIKFHIGRHR